MLHATAVDRAVSAAKLDATDTALVELLRTLARQMDAAGPEGPGTRLAASYLTGLNSLARRAREMAGTAPAAPAAAAGGGPGGKTTAQRRARAQRRAALVVASLDDRRGA